MSLYELVNKLKCHQCGSKLYFEYYQEDYVISCSRFNENIHDVPCIRIFFNGQNISDKKLSDCYIISVEYDDLHYHISEFDTRIYSNNFKLNNLIKQNLLTGMHIGVINGHIDIKSIVDRINRLNALS